ncbi:hypothetical protein JTE90_005174 [Oedothorax gibbosus]|uniref:Uncharacterized protein n=1 Tax=Oedothorax gibbosus TaxID=931172 RepID=A0AAV6TQD7_9ARAC|nr:hypothetical protein JTE90_005174 [Oedothorax gibbosus]
MVRKPNRGNMNRACGRIPAAVPQQERRTPSLRRNTTNNLREGVDIGAQVKNPFSSRSQQNAKPRNDGFCRIRFAVTFSKMKYLLNLNN